MKKTIAFSILSLLFTAPSAFAALGGDVKSVEADRTTLNLNKVDSKISRPTFNVEEMTAAAGNHIRQFVAPGSGKIFALSWTGKIDAQLPQLLGPYAKAYQTYLQQHPKTRPRIPYRRIETGGVVVEFWDVLRNVSGKAFVPELAPANVKAADVPLK